MKNDCRIITAPFGWVLVGYWEQDGDEVILRKAKNIRRWGTTQGLGELVNGPLKDTMLDLYGTWRGHRLQVTSLDVNPEKWAEHLK